MPPIETSDLYQYAVLWEKTGDDEYGEPIISPTPVELEVRWENTQKEIRKADNTLITLDALVVVKQRIPIGSIMWEGKLEDWYGTGSDVSPLTLMQVQTYYRIPDLKNTITRQVVGLSFFRGALPASS